MEINMLAKLKGWRTIALSILSAIWGVVIAFDWHAVVDDPHTLGYISLAIAVVTAVLRLDTHGPVGSTSTPTDERG